MNYYKVSITTPPDKRDLLIAMLNQSDYDGFEEEEFGFKTYIDEKRYSPQLLTDLADQFDFSYKAKLIPAQNWNAIWESNFPPLQIDDFCAVRADFHPHFDQVTHEITINPKMAFGTGHHETTLSVMGIMRNMDFTGKEILDYGCGTGILAILASKMGATSILAIDYDPLSVENSIENCEHNKIDNVTTLLGELSVVTIDDFDVILANINRNVILASLPALFLKTRENGQVLISGFLVADQELVTTTLEKVGFSIQQVVQKGEWLCMQLVK